MPYILANGVSIYYEEHGAGEPLLLLHGGGATIETSFAAQIPEMAQRYRVIAPERRGQGHTADVDGPITYDLMTRDTAAFMEALGLESAHIAGWSDGGIVGLLLATTRPDLVRKLVAIGANFDASGLTDAFIGWMRDRMSADTFPARDREAYARASPDGPEHFAVVLDKVKRMWLSEPAIPIEDLRTIAAPTLVLVGDGDMIEMEHTLEL